MVPFKSLQHGFKLRSGERFPKKRGLQDDQKKQDHQVTQETMRKTKISNSDEYREGVPQRQRNKDTGQIAPKKIYKIGKQNLKERKQKQKKLGHHTGQDLKLGNWRQSTTKLKQHRGKLKEKGENPREIPHMSYRGQSKKCHLKELKNLMLTQTVIKLLKLTIFETHPTKNTSRNTLCRLFAYEICQKNSHVNIVIQMDKLLFYCYLDHKQRKVMFMAVCLMAIIDYGNNMRPPSTSLLEKNRYILPQLQQLEQEIQLTI